jgi:hypothetical protein
MKQASQRHSQQYIPATLGTARVSKFASGHLRTIDKQSRLGECYGARRWLGEDFRGARSHPFPAQTLVAGLLPNSLIQAGRQTDRKRRHSRYAH